MKKFTLIVAFVSLGFNFILFVLLIIQVSGIKFSSEELFESCQGDYVNYNSFDPYCLRVIKQKKLFKAHYIILISQKDNKDYGHVINYPEYSVTESEIEKLKVIWTSEGVEILFSTGHKLFVPKERFTGGR